MASRVWQRIALAGAATASIATSRLAEEWNVSGGATFEGTLFDAQHTQVKYAIHAEVSGPGPYTDLAGLITASVRAQQLGMFDNAIQLRITLRSTTNPEVEVGIAEVTLPNITPEVSANLYAWTHCTTPPCAEDFEVVVETIGTGAPALDMTGGVRVDANGDNYDLQATTQVTVTTSLVP